MRCPSLRPSAASVAAVALALSGCGGQGHTPGSADLAKVPLVPGTKVVGHARSCDAGASSYCAVQFVVTGHGYRSAAALRAAELRLLRRRGWTFAHGYTTAERAANSPHGGLRLVFATALDDLEAADLGTIERPQRIERKLSDQLFSQTPALSATLETGIS